MFHQPPTTLLALTLALAGAALASPLHPQARQAAAATTAAAAAAAAGGAQNFAGDTQNGLTSASGATNCAQTIVIFARGTTETGNVGTLTGPPFFQALAAAVGGGTTAQLAVQGVDYPADVQGFLAGGDAGGSQLMAQLTQQAVGNCSSSKVVMSGYSQGGQLVHNAAAMLPADVSAKVAGAVIFGDPLNGKPVQGVSAAKTKIICHDGDNICQGGDLVLEPHLTYSQDAGTAAQFVVGL